MEAEQVINKILADAKAQADLIKEQAAKKSAHEQDEHDRILADFNEQTEAIAAKNAEDEKLHILAAARMDTAKKLLALKRNLLDQVFTKAKTQMISMPDDQYKDSMKKLMIKAVETGDEEVIVDKNEKRIDEKFIQMINSQLGTKLKNNLKLSEQRQNIDAGFILKRQNIKNNVSLNVLIDQAKKELEIQLAKDLFGN